MKSASKWAVAMGLALSIGSAQAHVISLVGDKDGFGVSGAPSVPGDGIRFQDDLGGTFFTDYRSAGDLLSAPFTDIWQGANPVSYQHVYSLDGSPLLASLTIQEAGMADNRGPYDVLFNGTSLGQIGIFVTPDNFQESRVLTYNVPVGLLTGADSIVLTTQNPQGDGFIINFSELVIRTDGVTNPVPETGTTAAGALLVAALGGRYLTRRTRVTA